MCNFIRFETQFFFQSIAIRFAGLFYIQKHRSRTVNEYLFIKLFVTVAPSSSHAISHFVFSSFIFIFFWRLHFFFLLSLSYQIFSNVVGSRIQYDDHSHHNTTDPDSVTGCCFSFELVEFYFYFDQDTRKEKTLCYSKLIVIEKFR